jgi:hypothetical protein
MAILADFFVASPEQATRYYNRTNDADGGSEISGLLQPASYTGFTSVQIGKLWAILDGVGWNVEQHELETIAFSEEGSWLQRFPAVLTQLLTDPSADQVASASVKWAATEEIDCSPEELIPVLKDLQTLAKRAIATNTSVYLWGSV